MVHFGWSNSKAAFLETKDLEFELVFMGARFILCTQKITATDSVLKRNNNYYYITMIRFTH